MPRLNRIPGSTQERRSLGVIECIPGGRRAGASFPGSDPRRDSDPFPVTRPELSNQHPARLLARVARGWDVGGTEHGAQPS